MNPLGRLERNLSKRIERAEDACENAILITSVVLPIIIGCILALLAILKGAGVIQISYYGTIALASTGITLMILPFITLYIYAKLNGVC